MRLLIILSLALTSALSAQTVEPAPADKAVVFFARPGGTGALINFTFFDGEELIAKFNGGKYYRYECEPGEHLFWARSENRSYVEAEVEAGKIYLLHVIPTMGGLKAQVRLLPMEPGTSRIKAIQKQLARRDSESYTPEQLADWKADKSNVIENGMERYEELKRKERDIPKLLPGMNYEPGELVFVKKKKKKG